MTSSALRLTPAALALAMAGLVATGVTSTLPVPSLDMSSFAQRVHGGQVTDGVALFKENFTKPQTESVFKAPPPVEKPVTLSKADQSYYAQLRDKLRWVDIRMGTNQLKTPDDLSRIVLVQSAAHKAGLHEVGLSFRDVYGIINAETSWIPRMGASKDGTPNLGIAQFEPATARAVGLSNPQDPVEAVHAAALHMKEAAVWSARRLEGLKLSPQAREAKLREGVSVYYNLSSKGRANWNGMNTRKLPIETQRHISNAALGAREAATIEMRLRELRRQDTFMANNNRTASSRSGS